jgi:hypothetical protein
LYCNNLIKIVDRAKKEPESLSSVEKWMLIDTIAVAYETIGEAANVNPMLLIMPQTGIVPEHDFMGPVNYNKFGILYHELGHIFHIKSTPVLSSFNKLFEGVKAELPLRPYIKSKYQEYVAEMFAGIMNNDKYPQTYMDLFHKVTNIRFPDIKTNVPVNK